MITLHKEQPRMLPRNIMGEDVSMVLEDSTHVEGKDTNREREKEFFSSVEEFHGIEVSGITSNKDRRYHCCRVCDDRNLQRC